MTKRKQIVALLVGVLLLAGVVGTFAWLSVTGVLVNEFGFGSVAPSVDETPKDNVKRDVSVKNTGSAPAYLRVAVDIYWQDQDGARLWDEPKEEPKGEADYEIAWSVADASGANSAYNWVKASDGFYYWTSPVAPGAETGVLINRVTELKATEGRNLVVDISTQAVQATPDEAVHDAWGCSVENDVLVPPHGGA